MCIESGLNTSVDCSQSALPTTDINYCAVTRLRGGVESDFREKSIVDSRSEMGNATEQIQI